MVTRVDTRVELLTEKERNLIQFIRDLKFGRFEITVKEGQPEKGEVPVQTVKF